MVRYRWVRQALLSGEILLFFKLCLGGSREKEDADGDADKDTDANAGVDVIYEDGAAAADGDEQRQQRQQWRRRQRTDALALVADVASGAAEVLKALLSRCGADGRTDDWMGRPLDAALLGEAVAVRGRESEERTEEEDGGTEADESRRGATVLDALSIQLLTPGLYRCLQRRTALESGVF